jgi:hypothetical protein
MSYGLDLDEAAAVLHSLADAFLSAPGLGNKLGQLSNSLKLNFEARYKALIERIPAVVFVAPLAAGLGSAYVSPQIESILGFLPRKSGSATPFAGTNKSTPTTSIAGV